MQSIKYGKWMLFLVLFIVQSAFSVTYTVRQDGSGNYKTIQSAVDAAGMGDEIVIMDTKTYAEQVTIDSTKGGLILRSEVPTSATKPTIVYTDKTNVGPTTCAEAKDTSKINWDRNGAVQVLGAESVRIEGIIIDGGGVFVFGYDGIWKEGATDCRWPLQYGNAALTLWVAGQTIVRDCELVNAYFGINVKDRNEGGIFGNANPGDVYPENVVPLSGFARTGNHLIEHNRIHDNSFGLYFESCWDMGSTIRYNLIYENHHPDGIGSKVKALTSDGQNQPGGAFMFKDDLLSPLAIYNNTFWNNFFIFVGGWNCSGVHLIFNNIFAKPYTYWGKETLFGGQSWQELSTVFTNRMYNCVFAAHQQAPDPNYVSIMNDMGQPKTEGDLIPTTFPATAKVRWLENHFLSVSPASADFLTPDWSNALVSQYIVDGGWATSGVKDPDGSVADVGAIPQGGGRPADVVTIRPTKPMVLKNGSVNLSFNVTNRVGAMVTPKFVFLRFVRNLDTVSNFGNDCPTVSAANMTLITAYPSNPPLIVGTNEYEVTVTNPGTYAFFELIIEGVGTDTRPFTSSVGFIPYRKLDYILEVSVLDKKGGKEITSVRAGVPVVLHVEAQKASGAAFTNKVDPTSISLQSPFDLLTPTGEKVTAVPGGITGTAEMDVVFTRVPVGGVEYVTVSGKWVDGTKILAFLGSSDAIRILPGPADSIQFQDPASHMTAKVDPGTTYPVKVQAFDKFGNKVDSAYTIKCISEKPDIGNIVVNDVETDTTGMAVFRAQVINGELNDTFPIVATLVSKPTATDRAFMVVGLPRDRLWVFYGDTLKYDASVGISGCAGLRVPVTIRAQKDSIKVVTTRTTPFEIVLTSGLAAYATATSTDKITASQLVAGKVTIFLQATLRNVSNGSITVVSKEPDVVNGDRKNINFIACFKQITSAAYFATNGRGAVDRVEIYYESPLEATEIPDSLLLFWPSTSTPGKLVRKSAIVLDPANAKHITVTLTAPFDEGITRFTETKDNLGKSYWWNPLTPEAPTVEFPFAIEDSVGPLLSNAILIERLIAGNDTLVIDFTETVDYQLVKGLSLTLIKGGRQIPLDIISAQPDINGHSIKAVIKDLIGDAPKEGDSLMITSAGPITDGFGNKAHPQNRPVVLTTIKIAPDIVRAVYLDRDANGTIETVQLTFNKGVRLGGMKMQFTWNGSIGTPADSTRFTFAENGGDTTVDVNVNGLFNASAMTDKTSGTMNVTAFFFDFESNNKKDIMATDGAAPVLKSVAYHYGKYTVANGAAPDTVYAEFTESLKGPPQVSQPINFQDGSRQKYTVELSYIGLQSTKYQFKVTMLQLPFHPAEADPVKNTTGDSAWINTDASVVETNVIDANIGNIQRNPFNKRVAITVNQPPFELNLQMGPNPFNPKNPGPYPQSGSVRISIKAMTEVAIPTLFRVSLTIYDKVGNLVKRIPEDDPNPVLYPRIENGYIVSDDSSDVFWNGTNRQGRIVGNGTYLGALKVLYTTEGTPQIMYSDNKMIGVKLVD